MQIITYRTLKADNVDKFQLLYYFGFDDLNEYKTFDGKTLAHLVFYKLMQAVKVGALKILRFMIDKTRIDFEHSDSRGKSARILSLEEGINPEIKAMMAGLEG